jgi:SNF family Na+-dependent transporter
MRLNRRNGQTLAPNNEMAEKLRNLLDASKKENALRTQRQVTIKPHLDNRKSHKSESILHASIKLLESEQPSLEITCPRVSISPPMNPIHEEGVRILNQFQQEHRKGNSLKSSVGTLSVLKRAQNQGDYGNRFHEPNTGRRTSIAAQYIQNVFKDMEAVRDSYGRSKMAHFLQDEMKAILEARYEEGTSVTTLEDIENNVSDSDTECSSLDDEPETEEAANASFDFLMTVLAFSVDLINIYRFPYLCCKYGGTFLICYTLCLFLIGMPLFYLENMLGQFHKKGPVRVWDLVPLFCGVGITQIFNTIIVFSYWMIFIVWSLYYLIFSFTSPLEWTTCGLNSTQKCLHMEYERTTFENHNMPMFEYFEREVLRIHECNPHNLGSSTVANGALLCLISCFVILFFGLWRGLHDARRVLYLTALLPYALLGLLIILSFSYQPQDSWNGLKLLVDFRWRELLQINIWSDAAVQVVFAQALGMGQHMHFSSKNSLDHNYFTDCITASFTNFVSVILVCVVIFSHLGQIAEKTKQEIRNLRIENPFIAFYLFPYALAANFREGDNILSSMFFIIFFLHGIDCTFNMIDVLISQVNEYFPERLQRKTHCRAVLTLIILIFLFFTTFKTILKCGLIFAYIDYEYSVTPVVLLAPATLTFAFSWIYGMEKLCEESTLTLGTSPNMYFRICWKFVTPTMLFIYVFSTFFFPPKNMSISTVVEHPEWKQYYVNGTVSIDHI